MIDVKFLWTILYVIKGEKHWLWKKDYILLYFNLKLTQKEKVWGRVADEFDERFPHVLREWGEWKNYVAQRVDWK